MSDDLTTDEFMEILKTAGFDYHTIYGVFPDTIYVDIFRIGFLQHKKIAFMKLKPAGYSLFQPEATAGGGVSVNIHECHFLPISGYDPNDCYVKMPELPEDGYRSGAALARMAAPEGYCKK